MEIPKTQGTKIHKGTSGMSTIISSCLAGLHDGLHSRHHILLSNHVTHGRTMHITTGNYQAGTPKEDGATTHTANRYSLWRPILWRHWITASICRTRHEQNTCIPTTRPCKNRPWQTIYYWATTLPTTRRNVRMCTPQH